MAGGKFDSHIVQSLIAQDTGKDEGDYAGFAGFSAYWQRKFGDRLGLRADYNVYADVHEAFKENDVIEQLVSVEPQLFHGDFIFSLPLQYVYGMEDDDSKYHRYSAAPTATFKLPDSSQAVEVYGKISQILDVDPYPSFDEDGHSLGGGMAYLISLKDRTYFRILGDYQRIYYDSRAWDYINESSSDKRHDIAASLGAEYNFQITRYLDLMASYTFIHTHTNVAIYDYDKHIVQAGVSFKF
jgi:hypothetical protein